MCYKLVLRKTTIFKNYGSIFVLIYFIGYLISFFMFCYRQLAYLKEEIGKLIMETKFCLKEIILFLWGFLWQKGA